MNKKDLCFHSWHGEPGKRKHSQLPTAKKALHTTPKPMNDDWIYPDAKTGLAIGMAVALI